MGEQVVWHVELMVRPGVREAFRELTGAMAEATRGELGVRSYERFIRADDMGVHVYERYVDSEAAVAHIRTFQRQFGDRFVGLVDLTRFTVYGTPSVELRGSWTVLARRTWPRSAVSRARMVRCLTLGRPEASCPLPHGRGLSSRRPERYACDG